MNREDLLAQIHSLGGERKALLVVLAGCSLMGFGSRREARTLTGYTEHRYSPGVVIQSFANSSIEAFFLEEKVPRRAGWSGISRVVMRKLDLLDYAEALSDLASPPGNRLEPLRGDLVGLHSIRANNQWRVVFRWTDQGPQEVDIRDYH